MKFLYTSILLLFFIPAFADDECESNLRKAKALIDSKSPFADASTILGLVLPCAEKGLAEAEHYMGLLHLNGIAVKQDNQKAFNYIQRAANKDFNKSQYNLGRMYKYGVGCKVDFEKSIYWFKKASENGNQKAAYSLGYMYFKGFAVPQDYQKAIYWFKQSEYAMSKYYLGVCYYFGYGVAANEDRALEILGNSNIPNSQSLVSYIKTNRKLAIESSINEILYSEASDSSYIEPEAITTTTEVILPNLNNIDTTAILGEWSGKLVQYDWSGKNIERIVPISIAFDADSIGLTMNLQLEGNSTTSKVQFQDGSLIIKEPMSFTMEKLYSGTPEESSLTYRLLSLNFMEYTLSNTTYFIAQLDTYIDEWTEYGEPMSIILKSGESGVNEEDELLMALAAQKEEFIKLYPVPFSNHITIQYDLEAEAKIHLEFLSLLDYKRLSITNDEWQNAGMHTITVTKDIPSLKKGLYIVRLRVGDKLYTRTVIKDN